MKEMTAQEVQQFLAQNRFGMLGLASGNRSYVVPLYYGFDGRSLYFHTHPGMKSGFIDDTEEACFAVARVQTLDQWASVESFGRIERLSGGPEMTAAMNALMSVPLPPEWGVSDFGEPLRGDVDVNVYRLTPTRSTGRKSEAPAESREEREIAFGGM